MKKRLMKVTTWFTLLALLLVACSGTNNTTQTTPTPTPATSSDNTEVEQPENKEPSPVTVKISNWPKPNDEAAVQHYENFLEQMSVKYPYITIERDEWGYDVVSFLPKAVSGQLPNIYETFFTEADKIINANYSEDVTEKMIEYGFDKAINPDLLELVKRDGKFYGIPKDGYVIGLMYNLNVMEEAGLIDADGLPMIPKTYDELAQFAVQIKEKTGKAGFFFPTKSNQGGWMFANIAWAYGADFEEQVDGKWKAIFNTPEAVAALQYVKDLKWKHDVLTDNLLVDMMDLIMLFGSDQVGMSLGMFEWLNPLIFNSQLPKEDLAISSLPSGPAGHAALLGGGLYMFAPGTTIEQQDALFKWLEVRGFTPDVTDEVLAGYEESLKIQAGEGYIIGPRGLQIWTDPTRVEKEQAILDNYINVDMRLYEDYMTNGTRGLRPEPPVNAQELYQAFDVVIQAVLTDKNSDPQALLDKAVADFQRDYLDKMN